MANLKNITEVPELTALSGTEKVLLNVDGSARQAAVSLIKPAEEWDAVITGTADTENGEDSYVLTSGTYESLVQKIENNEIPKIKLDGEWYFGSGTSSKMLGYSTIVGYQSNLQSIYVYIPCFNGRTLQICSDNSVSY